MPYGKIIVWNGKYYIGDSNNKPKQLYINKYETFQAGDILLSTTQPSSDWALCNGSETTTPIAGLKHPDIYNIPWTTTTSTNGNVTYGNNAFTNGNYYYYLTQNGNRRGFVKISGCNFSSTDAILPPSGYSFETDIWTLDGSSFLGVFQSSNNSSYYFKQGIFSGRQFVESISIPLNANHLQYISPVTVAWNYSNRTLYIIDKNSNIYYYYSMSGYQSSGRFDYLGVVYINGAFYYVNSVSTASVYMIRLYKSTSFNTSITQVFDTNKSGKTFNNIFYSDGMVIFQCGTNFIVFDRINTFKNCHMGFDYFYYVGYNNTNKELFFYNMDNKTTTSINIDTNDGKIISDLNGESPYVVYYYNHRYSAVSVNTYKYINDNKYKLPLIDVDQTLQAQAYIKIK